MNEILFSMKAIITLFISSLIAIFTPVKDLMLAMVVLFSLNFAIGFIADEFVLRLKRKQVLTKWGWYVLQCGLYFFVIFSLFAVGRLCHRDVESINCVTIVSVITIWVFAISILKGFKLLLPNESTMYKLADILLWIVSVKIVEKIPYIAEYLQSRHNEAQGAETKEKKDKKT